MNVHIDKNTRTYELMHSKDAKERKLAKRLMEYCDKCELANYEYTAVTKLREQYKDVL